MLHKLCRLAVKDRERALALILDSKEEGRVLGIPFDMVYTNMLTCVHG